MEGLSQSVLKMYMDSDLTLYDKCSRERNGKSRAQEFDREKRKVKSFRVRSKQNYVHFEVQSQKPQRIQGTPRWREKVKSETCSSRFNL